MMNEEKKCGICETWFGKWRTHCYVCGTIDVVMGDKHVFMRADGLPVARVLPKSIHHIIEQFEEK